VRDALEAIAVAAGHETSCAANGRLGLMQFGSFQPDLVITDMLMPEQEGIETVIELRKQHPTLPIIAISGGGRIGNTSFLDMAARFGATRIMPKPFSASEMISVISSCLAPSA
jgi:DNA-binding NtrC family response regulator